jgi:hypothetical protein
LRSVKNGGLPPKRHRKLKIGLLVFGVLFVAAAGVLFDAYNQARKASDPLEGISEQLVKVRNSLSRGGIPDAQIFDDITKIAQVAQQQIDGARVTFRWVDRIPLLNRPIEAVKIKVLVANEWAAAAGITRSMLLDLLGPHALKGEAKDSDVPAPVFHDGTANVALIQKTIPKLESLIAHLEAGEKAIRSLPSIPFYHRITEAKEGAILESERDIGLAKQGLNALQLLPAFLGADGPKTYFLALQNNSDLRATGGAVLAYGFLRVIDGKFDLLENGRIIDIDQPYGFDVAVPASLQWYLDNVPKQYARIANINWSPDFPADSSAWEKLVPAATQQHLDGVIAIDPVAISYLLGSHRFRVPEYPGDINGDNVVQVIEKDQYLLDRKDQKALTSALIDGAWQILRKLNPIAKAVPQLGKAITEKRMQIWLADPKQQELIQTLKWDGSLKVQPGDFFYVTDSKLLVNKVDYFTQTDMAYDVTVDPSGDLSSAAKITLTNTTPPGMPSTIVGPNAYAINKALMSLYVPKGAKLASSSPAAGPPVHDEGDATVFVRTITSLPDKPGIVQFSYVVPGGIVDTPQGKLYRLTIQHQPLVNLAGLTVTVRLPTGSKVTSAPGWTIEGSVATLKTTLTKDIQTSILFQPAP